MREQKYIYKERLCINISQVINVKKIENIFECLPIYIQYKKENDVLSKFAQLKI